MNMATFTSYDLVGTWGSNIYNLASFWNNFSSTSVRHHIIQNKLNQTIQIVVQVVKIKTPTRSLLYPLCKSKNKNVSYRSGRSERERDYSKNTAYPKKNHLTWRVNNILQSHSHGWLDCRECDDKHQFYAKWGPERLEQYHIPHTCLQMHDNVPIRAPVKQYEKKRGSSLGN